MTIRSLLRRFQRLVRGRAIARGFDLGGLLFAKLDDMLDQTDIVDPVAWLAIEIDLAMPLAGASAGEADVCLARLAGTVDNAADDAERHWRGDVFQPFFQYLDGVDDIEALTRAGRAGHDVHAAMAQVERLENVEAHPHFFHRVRREGHANGVTDAAPKQHAHADRRFHGAGDHAAGF